MPAACRGSADLKKVGLTRRGPPTCRHRRGWLRLSESALSGTFHLLSGRVPPPGEPVKVWRTVETKDDDPAFLGLHVLISFACALAVPTSILSWARRPRRVSPTSSLQKSKFNKHQSTILPLSRRWRQVGGPRRVSPTFLRSAEPRHAAGTAENYKRQK